MVRELSSERCETVRSLSSVRYRKCMFLRSSTKGLNGVRLLLTSCDAVLHCWVAKRGEIIPDCINGRSSNISFSMRVVEENYMIGRMSKFRELLSLPVLIPKNHSLKPFFFFLKEFFL